MFIPVHMLIELIRKKNEFEIAKQAVDFYFAHNTNKDAGVISFYGGEPLLEMELIKKIVVYSEKLYEGKELRFNMTSNATLLTDEIADFCMSTILILQLVWMVRKKYITKAEYLRIVRRVLFSVL